MRALQAITILGILCTLHATAQEPPKDSLSGVKDGHATLAPIATIAQDKLFRCAGLVRWKDAWWAHNSLVDDATLFRSTTLDFVDAQRLPVPNAGATRWEDLTTIDDDLLVCDIGDSARKRRFLTLYRVAWMEGRLSLVARYNIKYPAQAHDAEAAFTLNGKLHLVTRDRGEGYTAVFRWPELSKDETTVGEEVGRLALGENTAVTAADCDGTHLLLLSFTRIFVYASDKIEGKPAASTRIHANICKALSFQDGSVVFANQQRQVFAISDYISRKIASALPPRVNVELPVEEAAYKPDGTGDAWKSGAQTLPMKGVGEDEYVRWMIAGGYLMLAGKLRYEGGFTSSDEHGRRGSALTLMFGSEDTDQLSGDERMFWLGDNGVTGLDAWKFNAKQFLLKPLAGALVAGDVKGGWMSFEYALPLTEVFGQGKLPQEFRVNVWGYSLQGPDEPHLTGEALYSMNLPYTWAWGKVVTR